MLVLGSHDRRQAHRQKPLALDTIASPHQGRAQDTTRFPQPPMVGGERCGDHHLGPRRVRDRGTGVAGGQIDLGHVGQAVANLPMLGAQLVEPAFEGGHELASRHGQRTTVEGDEPQVVARGRGVGMPVPEEPLADGQGLAQQTLGLVEPILKTTFVPGGVAIGWAHDRGHAFRRP